MYSSCRAGAGLTSRWFGSLYSGDAMSEQSSKQIRVLDLAKSNTKCVAIATALHKDGHCGEAAPTEPYCDGCLVDAYVFLHVLISHKEAILGVVLNQMGFPE